MKFRSHSTSLPSFFWTIPREVPHYSELMDPKAKPNRSLYAPIDASDDDERLNDPLIVGVPRTKNKTVRSWMIVALTAAILSTLFVTLLVLKPSLATTDSNQQCPDHYDLDQISTTDADADHQRLSLGSDDASPCGHSRAEALAAGCVFDMLSYAWIPPDCYDAALTAEFEGLSDWRYFSQKDSASPQIPHAVVALGEHHHLFVTWEWHLRHCTYIWKRYMRATLPDGPMHSVDNVTVSDAHTLHCERLILRKDPPDLQKVNTRVRLKYLKCTRLGQ